MIRILLFLCFLGLSISSFSQTKVELHGPFSVPYDVEAIYGKNNRLFISSQGGVFYTDDRQTWEQPEWSIMDGIQRLYKDRDGSLYATNGPQIWKSTDNGENWTGYFFFLEDDVTGETTGPGAFGKYAISGDTLFTGWQDGLGYVVKDNFYGVAFHEFANVPVFDIQIMNNKIMALANGNKLYISNDRGATWTFKNLPFDAYFSSTLSFNKDRIFITGNGVWTSENGGGTWSQQEDTSFPGLYEIEQTNGKFYGVGNSVYVFDESLKQWKSILTSNNFTANAIAVDGNKIFAATSVVNGPSPGKLRESVNGGSAWNDVSLNGFTSDIGTTMAMDEDSTIYVGTNQAIYQKTKDEATFTLFNNVYNTKFIVVSGDYVYALHDGDVTKHSKIDGEIVWTIDEDNDISSFTVNKIDGSVIGLVRDYDLKVFKFGMFPDSFNGGLPGGTPFGLQASGDYMYVAIDDDIFRRANNGTGWSYYVSRAGGMSYFSVQDQVIFTTGGSSSAISTNGGNSWKEIQTNPSEGMQSLVSANGHLYATGINRIFMSYDNGETWLSRKVTEKGTLFPMQILPTKNSVYFSTWGDGVWSTKIKKFQNITFEKPDGKTLDDEPFDLVATSSEGLPVEFKVVQGDAVSVSDGKATILKYGNVYIEASQPGNDLVEAAVQVVQSFCVAIPTPAITASLDAGSHVILTSSNDEGNYWYVNDVPISGTPSKTYMPDKDGNYSVLTFMGGDCRSEMSNVLPIDVTGLEKSLDEQIKLYPNPATKEIFVKTPQQSTISIIDVTGRVVSQYVVDGNSDHRFDVNSLSNGFYFLRIESAGSVTTKRFSKL